MDKVKIGIVAPAARLYEDNAQQVETIARDFNAALTFHPQCFQSDGHFAGDDAARAKAFLEFANDPAFDVIWAGRGGYGSGRIADAVLKGLKPAAKNKLYFGYSDFGFLLAALYKAGHRVAHGPMVHDIRRENGDAAIRRALSFIATRSRDTLEPAVLSGAPVAAFNIIVLGNMIGTPLQPDLSGHILMLEEVSEHLYAIDRALFHITSNPEIRKIAGLMLGRCGDIPENDRPFGLTEEEIARHWCKVSGIPYLGRADIGHDIGNKIVPFGKYSPSP